MELVTLAASDNAFLDGLAREIEMTIIFGVGGVIAVIAIIFGTLSSMANKKQSESTKRELAAYVAEGSMTPADAERILRADQASDD